MYTNTSKYVKNTHLCIDGDNFTKGARLVKFFVNPKLGDVNEPYIMLDQYGHIIVWYLLHIFVLSGVVSIAII